MKKIIKLVLLIVVLSTFESALFAQAQWGNWSTASCYKGFQIRAKYIGFNKVVNKHEWLGQVQNNYGIMVGFNMSWTVGSEKNNIGRFDVSPGNTTNAATYYFNSNAGTMYIAVSGVCFEGSDCSAHCYADCDGRPGVPNQPPCNTTTNTNTPNSNYNTTTNNTNNSYNTTRTPTNTYSNNSSITNYDGGSELMPPNGRKTTTTTTTTTTNTKPLTPQEIQQQQQFNKQTEQQRQIYEQNIKMQQQAEQQKQQQLAEQQRKQQEQQERQAIIDQYNEAQMQKTISNIQNTPINTFEVGKLDIKNVKRQPASGTGVDKGSVSSISGLDKIEMEFPELSKKDDDIFYNAKPLSGPEKLMNLFQEYIKSLRPSAGGIMGFDLTINEKGKIAGVSLLSNPRSTELEDKLSSEIMAKKDIIGFKPAERNGKPVADNISYTMKFYSAAEEDKAKTLTNQARENALRTVTLSNGEDYKLNEGEYAIESDKVNTISGFSPSSIKARFNEFKNSIKEKIQYLKDTDLITMFQDANKVSDKTNESGGSSSSQSVQYAIINGRLCSVKRLDSKTTVYMYVD